MTVLSSLKGVSVPIGNALRAGNCMAIMQREMGSHGPRKMYITASRWQWHKFKDMFHFYVMLGVIPLGTVVLATNIFVGPAQLAPIPEDYTPKHWEYYSATNCQEPGCNAILQDPCGHEVCRTHAPCAIHHNDLVVWHHEACSICYDLVDQFNAEHPITRFLARYVYTSYQQDYEKYLHFMFEENEKKQMRLLEKKVEAVMAERGDSQSYHYQPVLTKYHKWVREEFEKNRESRGF